MMPYLSLAIWVPIVAGLAVLAVGRDRDAGAARWIALIGATVGLLVTLPLWMHFDPSTADMQFVERTEWIPRFDIHYHLGVDGISMLLVLLNSLMTLIVVWSAWEVIQVRVAQYMAAFLIQSGLINGAFSALDGILFYSFFEAMLTDVHGAGRAPPRVCGGRSATPWSLHMLVAFTCTTSRRLSIRLVPFHVARSDSSVLRLLPVLGQGAMWPVHTWLPMRVEAPTGGSVILAAAEEGAYGASEGPTDQPGGALAGFGSLSLIAVVHRRAGSGRWKADRVLSISHGFVTLGFVQRGRGRAVDDFAHGSRVRRDVLRRRDV
jgi:NADH-quinone oxidoreductase subunit M